MLSNLTINHKTFTAKCAYTVQLKELSFSFTTWKKFWDPKMNGLLKSLTLPHSPRRPAHLSKKYKQAENLNFCVFLPHTTVFILKLNTPLPLCPHFLLIDGCFSLHIVCIMNELLSSVLIWTVSTYYVRVNRRGRVLFTWWRIYKKIIRRMVRC